MRLSRVFLKLASADRTTLGQQRKRVWASSFHRMIRSWELFPFVILVLVLLFLPLPAHQNLAAQATPTFYRDILPLLQEHCQVCHRGGGIAPMAFENYESTRAYAAAIRTTVEQNHSMPPWFAEKGIGKISNEPSKTEEQIDVLSAWAAAKTPAGNPADAPAPQKWADRWTIRAPDLK